MSIRDMHNAYTNSCASRDSVCMFVCMYVCIYVCISVCIHGCAYVCTYIRMQE